MPPFGSEERRQLIIRVLLALMIFVFMHSFLPSDERVRMGLKPFEVEWGVTPAEIWYAVKKWRHLLWFAIFFPLVRGLFREHATRKALASIVIVTILIEFQQAFIAGRHSRLVDILPNLIGSVVGAVVYEQVVRRWRLSRSKSSRVAVDVSSDAQ